MANGTEGDPQSGWMLVDFGDLIVHIFSPRQRTYYDLEDLWSDAHVVLRMQ
jgi:ribosome-associated protein